MNKELIMKAASLAHFRKEEMTRDNPDSDISPDVQFFRDGVLQGSFLVMQVNRNAAVAVAKLAARAFQADAILANFDVATTKVPINPATNQPWQRGEIVGSPTSVEGILTVCVNQDGDIEEVSRDYVRVGGEVMWLTEPEYKYTSKTSSLRLGGRLVEDLQDAFVGPDVSDLIAGYSVDDLTATQAAFMVKTMIITLLSIILPCGLTALIPAESEWEATALERATSDEEYESISNKVRPLLPMLRERLGLT